MNKKGFTLIELVVVMAIIAILSVIIVGAILAARTAATNTQRTGAVRTLETALEARAARCNGLYFQAVATKTPCTALPVVTDDLNGLIAALKTTNPAFLTADVTLDQASMFTFTGDAAANTYTIRANDNNGGELYTATR
jgi:prepilin-type N-terminal cleavage/methylation domain-containing protein